jgi:tetraacyldisaccharide 4'-kinase
MRNTIVKVWKGEARLLGLLLHVPLVLLSHVYSVCLHIRSYLYRIGLRRVEEVSIPVISVGNISLGGTGKTPVVARLSVGLRTMGLNPGIITRGYKRRRKGTFPVDARRDQARDVGDEALMVARMTRVPVIVGKNRARAIEEGIRRFKIDVALLDDGFQVMGLKKDLEVLVLSAEEGKRNTGLFPLGPYRERIARTREADVILVNKGRLDGHVKECVSGMPVFHMRYKPAYLYNMKKDAVTHYRYVRNKRVLAFSGLGDNKAFFDLLKNMGAHVVRECPFPDHYAYGEVDLRKLCAFPDVDIMVTTEKDAVKIGHMELPDNLFYLSVDVVIDREQELLDILWHRVGRTALSANRDLVN